MRKPVLVVALLLSLAALAAPGTASASFDHHFSVIGKTVADHEIGDGEGFAFTDNLLDPLNPSNSVGRDRGRCIAVHGGRAGECHATLYLNGELGGEGTIRVGGKLSRGDKRLQVNGGSGDFNGVGGKLLVFDRSHNTELLELDLVR